MYLVQVLPKGRFGGMISFEFHLEKWYEKTQKPLWFLGFPNRYLFRFALLVAGRGLEPPDLRVSRRRWAPACPFAVPEKIVGLALVLDFFDRGTRFCLASSATGGARQRVPTSHARRSHNPESKSVSSFYNKEKHGNPKGIAVFFWLRGGDLNHLTSGL